MVTGEKPQVAGLSAMPTPKGFGSKFLSVFCLSPHLDDRSPSRSHGTPVSTTTSPVRSEPPSPFSSNSIAAVACDGKDREGLCRQQQHPADLQDAPLNHTRGQCEDHHQQDCEDANGALDPLNPPHSPQRDSAFRSSAGGLECPAAAAAAAAGCRDSATDMHTQGHTTCHSDGQAVTQARGVAAGHSFAVTETAAATQQQTQQQQQQQQHRVALRLLQRTGPGPSSTHSNSPTGSGSVPSVPSFTFASPSSTPLAAAPSTPAGASPATTPAGSRRLPGGLSMDGSAASITDSFYTAAAESVCGEPPSPTPSQGPSATPSPAGHRPAAAAPCHVHVHSPAGRPAGQAPDRVFSSACSSPAGRPVCHGPGAGHSSACCSAAGSPHGPVDGRALGSTQADEGQGQRQRQHEGGVGPSRTSGWAAANWSVDGRPQPAEGGAVYASAGSPGLTRQRLQVRSDCGMGELGGVGDGTRAGGLGGRGSLQSQFRTASGRWQGREDTVAEEGGGSNTRSSAQGGSPSAVAAAPPTPELLRRVGAVGRCVSAHIRHAHSTSGLPYVPEVQLRAAGGAMTHGSGHAAAGGGDRPERGTRLAWSAADGGRNEMSAEEKEWLFAQQGGIAGLAPVTVLGEGGHGVVELVRLDLPARRTLHLARKATRTALPAFAARAAGLRSPGGRGGGGGGGFVGSILAAVGGGGSQAVSYRFPFEAFDREVCAMRSVKECGFVCRFQAATYDHDQGRGFILMEAAPHGTLEELVAALCRSHRSISQQQQQLLAGGPHAHAHPHALSPASRVPLLRRALRALPLPSRGTGSSSSAAAAASPVVPSGPSSSRHSLVVPADLSPRGSVTAQGCAARHMASVDFDRTSVRSSAGSAFGAGLGAGAGIGSYGGLAGHLLRTADEEVISGVLSGCPPRSSMPAGIGARGGAGVGGSSVGGGGSEVGCLGGSLMGARALKYYGACTLQALVALHDAGWIFRDLKLSNVLLFEGGRVRLTDFGAAAQPLENAAAAAGGGSSGEGPRFGGAAGTRVFLAPEVAAWAAAEAAGGGGRQPPLYGLSVDSWNWGLCMVQLATGWGVEELTRRIIAPVTAGRPADLPPAAGGPTAPGRAPPPTTLPPALRQLLADHVLVADGAARWTPHAIRSHPFFADVDWAALSSQEGPHAHLFVSRANAPAAHTHLTAGIDDGCGDTSMDGRDGVHVSRALSTGPGAGGPEGPGLGERWTTNAVALMEERGVRDQYDSEGEGEQQDGAEGAGHDGDAQREWHEVRMSAPGGLMAMDAGRWSSRSPNGGGWEAGVGAGAGAAGGKLSPGLASRAGRKASPGLSIAPVVVLPGRPGAVGEGTVPAPGAGAGPHKLHRLASARGTAFGC